MSTTDTFAKQKMTRGQKLWYTLRQRRDEEPASLERARLVTASYKETGGLPIAVRRAKALEKIVTEIPIYIDDGQLLAGDYAAWPMAAEWRCEFEVKEISKEIEEGKSPYMLREEDIPIFQEICAYWKSMGLKESFINLWGEDPLFKQRYERSEEGAFVNTYLMMLSRDPAWFIPDFEKAIKKGLLGILDEVEQELQSTPQLDDASREKVFLLKAMRIVLKAGIQYGQRYAALATELAQKADGERKRELERIAEVCTWVPANPARSFQEALQLLLFVHLLMYWETRPCSLSLGRVDQYLYPYYKQDIEEGKLTPEEAIELLECLRVKFSSVRDFHYGHIREGGSGEVDFYNCTLGGQTADGGDATNELSYLWIEAAMRTRTSHPTLSIRVHEKLPPDFAMKGAELCSLGLGYPAWFGDKTTIPWLLRMGCTLEEARGYALAGCVVHVIPGKTSSVWPIMFGMPKVFELTLNDGVDPRTGKQLGPKTGSFEDLSYDELYSAYKEQLTYFITDSAKGLNEIRLHWVTMLPQVAASCFFDDCIKRGQTPFGGGCIYQDFMYLLPIGVIDVVDSLAAIKQRVFEEGSVSKQELMEALKVNFEGKENIRRLLLTSHKYGNDDDYADHIAVDLYSWLSQLMGTIDACYGVKYINAPHSVAHHGAFGKAVGALPSGRLAGVSLADGGVSPCQGGDRKGPTAVIKSASKIDQLPLLGTLFNMKFHPSALKTREDLKKFLTLIRTYLIDLGGKHIQFNVVGRDTLLDAQAHPENYRNLIVRVAGYSALWVELNRTIQDDIISRTEHSL